jgi:hypothetical protein
VALLLLALHAPPLTALDKLIVEPTVTDDDPLMVPASGAGFTVTTSVATAAPQLLVTL